MQQLKGSNFHPWKELATYSHSDSVFYSNLSLVSSLTMQYESFPAFYSEVIKLCEKFVVCSNLTAEQILSEQLQNKIF